MTGYNYRFSVIPAGAILDARLEPRDFQVLALLGRHAKAGGWLWRSQVKMAKELKCARSTVQRSLNRLVDAGWVDTRLRGRGEAEPNAEKQPFAAHYYRVKLDNDVPDDVIEAAANEESDDDGCLTDGHPGADPDGHGGAHPGGHHEGTPSEGTPIESERETHASENAKPNVGAFNRRWPTASSDDQKRTKQAWDGLGASEWQPCLDGIEPFLKKAKADGRVHIIAGWRYIEEKRWTLLPEQPKPIHNPLIIKSWSREWWAALFRRIERREPTDFMLRCALSGGDWAAEREPVLPEDAAALQAFPNDGEVMAAWRPWFAQRRVSFPEWRQRFWVYLPGHDPPRSAAA